MSRKFIMLGAQVTAAERYIKIQKKFRKSWLKWMQMQGEIITTYKQGNTFQSYGKQLWSQKINNNKMQAKIRR